MSALAPLPRFLPIFVRLKGRLARNHLNAIRGHWWVHVACGLFVLTLLLGGGRWAFSYVFGFLMRQGPFGPPLMDRAIGMTLLAFFSMMIFSNLIIMLMTTYFSREVEHLMAQPISRRALFFGKLGESIVYSSWAFVVLSYPFFVSVGRARDLDWTYYTFVGLMIVPYLIIPAALGAIASLLMTTLVAVRRVLKIAVPVVVAAAALGLATTQIPAVRHAVARLETQGDDLTAVMRFMALGDAVWLPSAWMGRGMLALARHQWREVALWAAALWTTALMGVVVCDALVPPLFYRGWCRARGANGGHRRRRGGWFTAMGRLMRWMPAPIRSVVVKDIAVFWRDPTQWGQIVILFGLLTLYAANLRNVAGLEHGRALIPLWRALVALFSIGSSAFVLSILTTRFVYPMLSLEGRRQWVLGLAPFERGRLVWLKYFLSATVAIALTLPLTLFSCRLLELDRAVTLLAVASMAGLGSGLSALAVGLGAIWPNFGEDNPARIANGLGGTLNALLSLLYVGLTLALLTPWVFVHLTTGAPPSDPRLAVLLNATLPASALLHLVATALPLRLGLTRWRRIEF